MVNDLYLSNNIKNIVVFGADQGGLAVIDLAALCGWKIIWFVGCDESKWGSMISGFEIKSPDSLAQRDFDLVVVSSMVDGVLACGRLEKLGLLRGKDFIFSTDSVKVAEFTLALKLPATMESGKKVVIYGAGQGGLHAMDIVLQYGWEIKYFVDGDSRKWGGSVRDYEISSFERLLEKEFDFIVVASFPGKKDIFVKLNALGFKHNSDYFYYQDEII